MASIFRRRRGDEEEAPRSKDEFLRRVAESAKTVAMGELEYGENFRELEWYWVEKPFAKVHILENVESGERIYVVHEAPLRREEEALRNVMMRQALFRIKEPPRSGEEEKVFLEVLSDVAYELGSRLRVPSSSWAKILYYVRKEIVGFGPIDPIMKDELVEDIMCNGVGRPVFVSHRKYGNMATNIKWDREEDLNDFVMRLAYRAKKTISMAQPYLDATLPDGSRLAATYGSEISTAGPTFVIRKFLKKPLTILHLVKYKTLDSLAAAFLWVAVEYKRNFFTMGVTGAGKTTLLNALATLYKPTTRIVTVEEVRELKIPLPNWVPLVTRPGGLEGEHEITLYDLVKVSLRYRPDVVIVGEVRGEEAYVLFQSLASVGYDTPILVRDASGRVSLVKIGEFVDRFYAEGEERIAKPVEGYEVLSHDGYRAVWKPVKYVLRHRADEVYEIEYEGGGRIEATGSHSVFVIDPESLEIREKRVDELGTEDLLLSHARGDWRFPDESAAGRVPAAALIRLAELTDLNEYCTTAKIRRGVLVSKDEAGKILECVEKRGVLEGEARKLYERIRAFMSGDLVTVRIRAIRVKKYDGYVYDVSVPGTESFFGGNVPVLLHNTGHSGACLPPWGRVPVVRDGWFDLVKIEELFREASEGRAGVRRMDAEAVPAPEGLEVFALGPDGRLRLTRPSAIIRKREPGDIVTLRVGRAVMEVHERHLLLTEGEKYVEAGGVAGMKLPGPRVAASGREGDAEDYARGLLLGALLASGWTGGRAMIRGEAPALQVAVKAARVARVRMRVSENSVEILGASRMFSRLASRRKGVFMVSARILGEPEAFRRGLVDGYVMLGGLDKEVAPSVAAAMWAAARSLGLSWLVAAAARGAAKVVAGDGKVEVEGRFSYDGPVYDLEVYGYGNYVHAPGVVAHNSTFHAESFEGAVKRFLAPPMNIPEGYIPLLHLAVLIVRYDHPRLGFIRRIWRIYETISAEEAHEVVQYDPFTDSWKHDLENSVHIPQIAYLAGKSKSDIFEEIELRRRILEAMLERAEKDPSIMDYERFAPIIQKFYTRRDEFLAEWLPKEA